MSNPTPHPAAKTGDPELTPKAAAAVTIICMLFGANAVAG